MKVWVNKFLYSGGVVFDIARWMIFFIVLLVIVSTFWLTIFLVDGVSMEPNLHDREVVVLQKNAYLQSDPARGDVVVVQYPGDPERKRYVKRVVGLPGEKVEVTGGKVYINKVQQKELFLPAGTISEPSGNWQLKADEYFLMGDNRGASNDSRFFGGVEKRFFVGRALYIIYPRIRSIKDL